MDAIFFASKREQHTDLDLPRQFSALVGASTVTEAGALKSGVPLIVSMVCESRRPCTSTHWRQSPEVATEHSCNDRI
ncbi:hypothetical protein FHS85_003163 [Rhodoligotrophos appendicifer]|nr:hypothetical protein [Rhodoligotrophos appendicifer]